MPKIEGIVRVNAHQFKGFRMIRITSVPSRITGDICGEILAKCRQAAASVELLITSSDKVNGELGLFLILRAAGSTAAALKIRLDQLSASVVKSLEGRSIPCDPADTSEKSVRALSDTLHGDMNGICFFPPESLPGKSVCYVPGRYNTAGLNPVDLGEIASVLSSYPGVMLSINAAVTAFSKPETAFILRQAAFLRGKKDLPLASAALNIYEEYSKMASGHDAIFEISFCAFGTAAFINDIASRVSLTGLLNFRFPFRQELNLRYLCHGDRQLTTISRLHGHSPAWHGRLSDIQQRLSHLCRAGDISAAFSLPSDLSAVSGLRINRIVDTTEPLPEELSRPDGIFLGRYHKTGQEVYLPADDLTRHGFFTGKPGSGKTVFALWLLSRLHAHKNKYPFLAFEPAKKEYRSLLGPIPELKVYTPGCQDVSPIQLNIFLPPPGVRLEQYQPVVKTIFNIAISMPHPLDIIFPQVIDRTYARYGWRPDSTRDSEGVRIFGLHEFIREFRRYTQESYSQDPEALHNIESGGIVRLTALLNSPIFDTNESMDIEELLTHPTVIELDALSDNQQRAIVIGILLSQIMMYLRYRKNTHKGLKNMILIDEAHLLLDQNDTVQEGSPQAGSAVVEMLQNMTVILRAYGTSLMFGDQSAARLTSVILSNVNLKMMFRMDSLGDRQILAEEAMMSQDMITGMVSLPAGQCYMYCDQLPEPVYLTVPNAEAELKLDKSIPDEYVRDHMKTKIKPPFYQCSMCTHCQDTCDDHIRSDARFIARQLKDSAHIRDLLEGWASQQAENIPAYLKNDLAKDALEAAGKFRINITNEERLIGCTRIQLIRELLMSSKLNIEEDALTAVPEEP